MSLIYIVTAGDEMYAQSGNDNWLGVCLSFEYADSFDRYKPIPDWYDDDDDEEKRPWEWFAVIEVDTNTRKHREVVHEYRVNRTSALGHRETVRVRKENGVVTDL